MANKVTLETIASQLNKQAVQLNKQSQQLSKQGKEVHDLTETVGFIVKHMGTKEDLEKLATKEQVIALHMQVNSIETELRDMKRHKLVTRVTDLEEKVFGAARE
jgi:hypothetical protein